MTYFVRIKGSENPTIGHIHIKRGMIMKYRRAFSKVGLSLRRIK